MTAMEPLQRLFFRANDMVQEVSDSFEQHFLWLEEVVAEARQTLTSADLHLLPKTPSAAPRRTRRVVQETSWCNFGSGPKQQRKHAPKRARGQITIKMDQNFPTFCLASSRLMFGSEDGENLAPATSQTARRGRLCSKLALEKIQEQGRISKIKKLRRPSSTIPQVLPSTTHKRTHFEVSPSHSGSEEEPGESPRPKCETVIPTSPRSSFGSFQQNTKLVLLPREPNRTPQKDASPQKTYPTSPQKNDSPSQEAPPISTQKGDNSPQNDDLATPVKKVTSCEKERKKSQRDNICQDQNSPQAISSSPSIDLISPCRKSSPKKVVSESPGPSTRLKKSSISENISNQKNISEKAPQEEDMGDSSQDTTKATVVPQAPPHEEEEFHLQLDESHDEDSEEEQDIEMVCELPKNAITQGSTPSNEISSTEQIKEDVISLSSLTQTSSIDNGEVSCTNSEAIEVKNVSSSSSTVPTSYSLPAPRITHSTQKAIESLDTPCSSDILPQSPSVPAPRVTRTKQKATKVQDIPSLSEGLPQPAVAPAPRITRTKQKAIEAQVLLPPESIPQPPSAPAPRVTRTKQKAIEKEMAPPHPSCLSLPLELHVRSRRLRRWSRLLVLKNLPTRKVGVQMRRKRPIQGIPRSS
ncbi:hypothetical protein GWK47_050239 [Chionoecetes opilio]|uniref:Uncharacterized protein n=1 Tax=Chionoecetes opilio TaxID=41210 RepID=A0A8J4Y2T2_CHIOP|nr:hypothetical protein GWK47_050239 [Chionoecetes opilio]